MGFILCGRVYVKNRGTETRKISKRRFWEGIYKTKMVR